MMQAKSLEEKRSLFSLKVLGLCFVILGGMIAFSRAVHVTQEERRHWDAVSSEDRERYRELTEKYLSAGPLAVLEFVDGRMAVSCMRDEGGTLSYRLPGDPSCRRSVSWDVDGEAAFRLGLKRVVRREDPEWEHLFATTVTINPNTRDLWEFRAKYVREKYKG